MTTTALSRMINRQAEALAQVCELDLSEPAAVLGQARRVVMLGTGTSQHAAELGAMLLSQDGREVCWYPAATWARWSVGPRTGDALCVITHTAETAYAARARASALAAGIPVVSITGPGRGWPEAIETIVREESHTYTVSYSSALAVLARLAHELGSPEGSAGQVTQVAGLVREICAAPDADQVAMPARSLAIVGCGPWGITAREGALKIREAARVIAEGFDTDRLLHGGAVPYTAADGLVVLAPGADPDGLTGALAEAARREGMQVSVMEDTAGLPPLLAQIPMTVRLQLVAERFARLRRQDPDRAIVGAWDDPALWSMGAPGPNGALPWEKRASGRPDLS
ncbi:MAG TPA: hypothetical protein VIV12_25540 [Streptosporangiaceae bacterium]